VTYKLMHLAYQGDISRVFVFMTGHEASDRAYGHIGIPAVIVGGGCGRMKGNRHIVVKDTPTANLLLALAHVGGVEIESLPASTGEWICNKPYKGEKEE
jgi:hypothetical protein